MKHMRYINLFEKVSRVSTKNCFVYNNQIIFVVPLNQVSRAIGPGASNVKQLSLILRRKIKVIGLDDNFSNIEKFIKDLVEPVEFDGADLKEGVLTITGDREARAMLIGRNRIREKELKDILSKMFKVQEVKFS